MVTPVTPYGQEKGSKKQQIAQMFNAIATKYDFFNHFFTLGIDIYWRKVAIQHLQPFQPKNILDVATGTGDFAIAAVALKPERIIGVDISEGMLSISRKKIQKANLQNVIEVQYADSENLPFAENTFDAITVGFGVRNFENLELGLSELFRVLKKNGVLVILEPSFPTRFPWKQLFQLYFQKILPFIASLFSPDKFAYQYLPNSVAAFPSGKDFLAICKKIGFINEQWKPLTLGTCALYLLQK
ncbi:MAG: bifunctional demethylmenaquinone methyltransferase/2-methoxy-6-polyprenyl-1,4-benzoquinol methylase UbiE [Bacteroidia bacterium]|nr:bifunctional demethylmenaquinone methyltransferase/2-methoxy-6-polyprenyl-1,4-benzoquinol methylase UbiE [Bacteroidia bacterium]MDW8157966.1 bifunctional demethylmenaquinone methyltransferase/2-methoxy-6-polyprenyl-1,4-benzoquinol methylase UbiE [Bacteroidia bacterium]